VTIQGVIVNADVEPLSQIVCYSSDGMFVRVWWWCKQVNCGQEDSWEDQVVDGGRWI
jgi:hypothetical protein